MATLAAGREPRLKLPVKRLSEDTEVMQPSKRAGSTNPKCVAAPRTCQARCALGTAHELHLSRLEELSVMCALYVFMLMCRGWQTLSQ